MGVSLALCTGYFSPLAPLLQFRLVCCRWKMPRVGGKAWQGHGQGPCNSVFPPLIRSGLNDSCLRISCLWMCNTITVNMPSIWHGWRDGWVDIWAIKVTQFAKQPQQKGQSELKNNLSIDSGRKQKNAGSELVYSTTSCIPVCGVELHLYQEIKHFQDPFWPWSQLSSAGPILTPKIVRPDKEQLHPSCQLGTVWTMPNLGKLCPSPGLLGVGQNHAREGLNNNSRDGGALVPWCCPGMAQLAGLDESRVNPAPQMCQRSCPPIFWCQ